MDGGISLGGKRQDDGRQRLQLRGEIHTGVPVHAAPGVSAGHQPGYSGHPDRGVRRSSLLQEDAVKGEKKKPWTVAEVDPFYNFLPLQLRHKMLEAHTNVKDLNLLEAKMNFIKAWQSLPDYGVTLFVARFLGEKRDELIGIAFNRLMRMNLHSGDHIKTWRFNTIKVGLLRLYA